MVRAAGGAVDAVVLREPRDAEACAHPLLHPACAGVAIIAVGVSPDDVTAEWIEHDRERLAYLARPRGGSATAALLVLHEAFGLNADIQAVCDRLARGGYAALAPDLYRRGPDRLAGYDERDKAIAMLKTLPDEQVLADAAYGLDLLCQHAGDVGLGVVGFRIGGRYALLVAERERQRVAAAVAFYGAGIDGGTISPRWTINALERARDLRVPVLLIFVGDDPTIPDDEVRRIEHRLREFGARYEIVRYPGVRPGFTFPARDTYASREADDAWRRTMAFLDAHLHRDGAAK
jgi:carboxymethylenebutenolidase